MWSHPAEAPAADPPALPVARIMRTLRVVLGCVVAAGTMFLALWLWDEPARGASCLGLLLGVSAGRLAPLIRTLAVLSAGTAQFIFICLATDEICRHTPPLLVVFLKTLTAVVAGGSLLVAAWQVWQLRVL
jgi:hypothetical protein